MLRLNSTTNTGDQVQSTIDSFEDLRKDFPVLNRRVRDDKKLVYFDNAATTQKPNQVIDAITDPLVGYYSDRTRSKWGRRHPYMYAAAIPVAITYYFLWTPPEYYSDWQLFFYFLICAIIIRVFIK